ncbi:purine-cytosine permease [Fomes fomentarius]|nr:purine-cytosine permease [Fomes fomentarius]
MEVPKNSDTSSETSHEHPRELLAQSPLRSLTNILAHWGIETKGIDPVFPEDRDDTKLYQMFLIWFSVNMNITSFGIGSAGPAFFGLGLRDSLLIIFVVDFILSCSIACSSFAVFGPKLGMRSMVLARYSWGYYGSIVASALNVFTYQGWLIAGCIIGGQTLASTSDRLNETLGIVIIALISLGVSFCGYRVIHWYESVAWISSLIAYIAMLGIGGKHLGSSTSPGQPRSAATILSFATTVASNVLGGCTMTPDYGVYHTAKASGLRVFFYSYAGFLLACLGTQMLGAAFAAAAPAVPKWEAGLGVGGSVGGLIQAVLASCGGFGTFLTALLALFVPSACVPIMYTLASSFMAIHASFARIPRYVYAILSTAILIPVAIIGATHFYATLVNILNLAGYWIAVFTAIVIAEHLIFPVVTFVCACAIIVPCMSQGWYIGPIARAGTGDIGVLVGFALAAIVYPPLRAVERAVCGK